MASESVSKARAAYEKVKDDSYVPAPAKQHLSNKVVLAEQELCEATAARNKLVEASAQRKEELEMRLCDGNTDFTAEAAVWASKILVPPGPSGRWKKPPHMWK